MCLYAIADLILSYFQGVITWQGSWRRPIVEGRLLGWYVGGFVTQLTKSATGNYVTTDPNSTNTSLSIAAHWCNRQNVEFVPRFAFVKEQVCL